VVDDDDVESVVFARSPRLQRILKSRSSIAAVRELSAKTFGAPFQAAMMLVERTAIKKGRSLLAVCLPFRSRNTPQIEANESTSQKHGTIDKCKTMNDSANILQLGETHIRAQSSLRDRRDHAIR